MVTLEVNIQQCQKSKYNCCHETINSCLFYHCWNKMFRKTFTVYDINVHNIFCQITPIKWVVTFSLIHLLTPLIRDLIGKLVVSKLFKKFSKFYGTQSHYHLKKSRQLAFIMGQINSVFTFLWNFGTFSTWSFKKKFAGEVTDVFWCALIYLSSPIRFYSRHQYDILTFSVHWLLNNGLTAVLFDELAIFSARYMTVITVNEICRYIQEYTNAIGVLLSTCSQYNNCNLSIYQTEKDCCSPHMMLLFLLIEFRLDKNNL